MKVLLLKSWLGLALIISVSWPAVGATVVPMPPVLGWTTDGVSAPDQSAWPTEAVPQNLGFWNFDSPTRLAGFRSDPPLITSNLFLVPSPWGYALQLSPDAPACLRFGVRQANTNGDFSVRNGTVSLWLRPGWTSGGPAAPAVSTPLVEAGTNSVGRLGWWAWLVSPGGGEIQFLGQSRGQQLTWLRAPVRFTSNQWIHLALTWSPTNSCLYTNGVAVIRGAGITHWPAFSERESNGWGAGGDRSGQLRIPGDLDLLSTANYPLSSTEIQAQYASALAAQREDAPPVAATQSATSGLEFGAPSLPTAARPGLWIEGALGAATRAAGGWLHGTVPGTRYEVFSAGRLEGSWVLDQSLNGAAAQDWTPFDLQGTEDLPRFILAASYVDTDQDGLSDEYEKRVSRTSASKADSDDDGMPDGWEVEHRLNPLLADGLMDTDGDGFLNGLEYVYQTNPASADAVPVISVRATVSTIREGASSGRFILKRTGSTSEPLEVDIELTGPSVNGYDFTEVPRRGTFAVGRSELELTINPLVDGRDEKDESVILTVQRGEFYQRDTDHTAQMSIQDSDLPSVSIRATDPKAREPEFGRFDYGELQIERDGLTDLPLVVNLKLAAANNAVAGTDVGPLAKSVTIPAGEIRVPVPVIPINNQKLTGPRSFVAEIAPSAAAYTIESGMNLATVTIADVAPLVVTVTADDPMAEEKGLSVGRFKFTRGGGSARSLTVFYHIGGTAEAGIKEYTRNPADYEALPGFVVIPAGSNEALVEVKPIADSLLETLETVQVTLAGSLDYVIGTANTATVTIDDSNASSWSSRLARPTSVAGVDGPEGLIEVTRFGTVLVDVTIPFQVAGQRILKPSGQVLSFGDAKLTGSAYAWKWDEGPIAGLKLFLRDNGSETFYGAGRETRNSRRRTGCRGHIDLAERVPGRALE